jgi:hypothetical protein
MFNKLSNYTLVFFLQIFDLPVALIFMILEKFCLVLFSVMKKNLRKAFP